ncbi:MAG: DUF1998 domain-containing protein, partial [Candidatus Thiodiazotropha taylori]
GQNIDPDSLDQFTPTLFLYDNYPGGIGITNPLFEIRSRIVADARNLVESCDCACGCPGCIGPILAGDEQGGNSAKHSALTVLSLLSNDEP